MSKLLEWRKTAELTQIEAAQRLRVDQSSYSKWENAKAPIPIERVPAVSEITGIPRIELRPDKPDLFG